MQHTMHTVNGVIIVNYIVFKTLRQITHKLLVHQFNKFGSIQTGLQTKT